jgi:hypothetical protein
MSFIEIMFWLTDPMRGGLPGVMSEADRLHGLSMGLAAGLLLPLAVLLARYFKILPGQDWPRQLNRRSWWFGHLVLAYAAAVAVAVGTVSILQAMAAESEDSGEAAVHLAHLHGWIGWVTVAMLVALLINGWQRGTSGGPGKRAPGTLGPVHGVAGDHYDMTARRRWFERTHKLLGYLLLTAMIAGVISGLWRISAPRWVLVVLAAWWVLLLLLALRWERQGRCVDGYQAKWGPSMVHPGNRIPKLGWGSRRYTEEEFGRLAWAGRRTKKK